MHSALAADTAHMSDSFSDAAVCRCAVCGHMRSEHEARHQWCPQGRAWGAARFFASSIEVISVEDAAERLVQIQIAAARFYYGAALRDPRRCQHLMGSMGRIEVVDDATDIVFTIIDGPDYMPLTQRISQCDVCPIGDDGRPRWNEGFTIDGLRQLTEAEIDEGLARLLAGP